MFRLKIKRTKDLCSRFMKNHRHYNYTTDDSYSSLSLLSLAAVFSFGLSLSQNDHQVSSIKIKETKFSTIVVGGGSGGCTTAYFLAKWMQQNNIPGDVLLIDRGVDFTPEKGPNPKIDAWFENWGIFGEAHQSIRTDGSPYPVTGSDHKGIGGCGSHDTRITFQPRSEQKDRMAMEMGWSREKIDTYYQAALNVIPITRSIRKPEKFYTAVINALTKDGEPLGLNRLEGDEHKTGVVVDSIAESSLAVYEDEIRWSSAFLLKDGVRPSNLHVLSEANVDKVLFKKEGDRLEADGILVKSQNESFSIMLENGGDIALSSGALGNVGILQRSGIGPSDILRDHDVDVLIDNPEVGHGVDHQEIAVLYEWLDQWCEENGEIPRGGVMGWPMIIFASFFPGFRDSFGSLPKDTGSQFLVAHFGAGFAEPYTDFPSVVATPSCARPDLNAGYRAKITSKDPEQSLLLVHEDQRDDWVSMAEGVFRIVSLFEIMQKNGLVGKQLEPPFPVTFDNREKLVDWIKENHWTVFHWGCTCQAGVTGRVADQQFRIRTSLPGSNNNKASNPVVKNLLVGSAASLPQLPEANPHLSVTAFGVALAEVLLLDKLDERVNQSELLKDSRFEPEELVKARNDVKANGGKTKIRRPGEEVPSLSSRVSEHYKKWVENHADENE